MKKRKEVEDHPQIVLQNRFMAVYRSTRLNVWGNPWYIVSFWDVLTHKERKMFPTGVDGTLRKYQYACKKIRGSGLKPYKGKDFGGGFAMCGLPNVVLHAAMKVRFKRLKKGT